MTLREIVKIARTQGRMPDTLPPAPRFARLVSALERLVFKHHVLASLARKPEYRGGFKIAGA